jgi:2-oxoisovalerate dehydrogenase E2 component (dihydrolipoyl transacylase)
LAHHQVVHVSIYEDADVEAWGPQEDPTLRLMRALIYACRVEPALNAWFDGHSLGRRLLPDVHLGVAVDSVDGLFVPVIRRANLLSDVALRQTLDELIEQIKHRKIPPEALRGNTITLSNFGAIAGRYASPVIVPPTVAILGAGRMRKEVVVVEDQPAVHKRLPLSLTFDHRCVTGGEAARFIAALVVHLQKATLTEAD